MPNFSIGSEVSQLVVIGRGMASDFEPSEATYARAVAAAMYYQQNPSLERVIFSSGYSSLAGAHAENRPSEASLMAEIAHLPSEVEVKIEEDSTNTLENFLNSAPLLELNRTTGVLAHTAHLPRALFIARKVLGVPIAAVEAERLGAKPESKQSVLIEKLQLAWIGGLLVGVNAGDLEAIRDRNERDKQVKRIVGSGLKTAASLLKIRMPQQYQ